MAVEKPIDQFDLYGYAVKGWLEHAPFETVAGRLSVVYAPPDKAFGAVRDLLDDDGILDANVATVPLPFLSFYKGGSVAFDQRRFGGPSRRLRSGLGKAGDGLTMGTSPYPMPYTWEYRIEVWARSLDTLNRWQVWIANQFPSFERMLPVDFTELDDSWGIKLIPLVNRGLVDNSEIEGADDESNRVLRATQVVEMQGWVFPQVEATPVVKRVRVDWRHNDSGKPLPLEEPVQEIEDAPDDFPLLGTDVVP